MELVRAVQSHVKYLQWNAAGRLHFEDREQRRVLEVVVHVDVERQGNRDREGASPVELSFGGPVVDFDFDRELGQDRFQLVRQLNAFRAVGFHAADVNHAGAGRVDLGVAGAHSVCRAQPQACGRGSKPHLGALDRIPAAAALELQRLGLVDVDEPRERENGLEGLGSRKAQHASFLRRF